MEAFSLQMIKRGAFSSFSASRMLEVNSEFQRKGFLRFRSPYRVFGVGGGRRKGRVCCNMQDDDNIPKNNKGEPPESLFTKELRKRGISPTSLLNEINNDTIEEDVAEGGGDPSFSRTDWTRIGLERSYSKQREPSLALTSEGLEELILLGKFWLRVGGTFFLAFWPLILVMVAFFAALSLCFGSSFVHDGSKTPISLLQYIDPFALFQEEGIMQ